jgi:TPR repeat protein
MWYSKAAETGHPVAQYDLGVCYYNGKGVPQSRDEAVKWWRVAAQQGNENAKKALRDI